MILKKLKKLMKWSGVLLIAAVAIVAVACGDDSPGGTSVDTTDYSADLSWGNSFTPLTLGLTPGNDTTEIGLSWYSSGNPGDKVAKVRFIEGTKEAGVDLIEKTGTVDNASSGFTTHKATVTGLKPGSSYQYSVSTDGTNWSPMYNFKVPAATGAWKFAVIADPQLTTTLQDVNSRNTQTTTAAGWTNTMDKIVAAGVSFIASGGDQVDASGGNEAEYTNLFAPTGMRSLPLAPVPGNHDNHLHYNYHYNIPNIQTFADETVATEKERNYFYLYNNILFVVLNTAPYPSDSQAVAEPHVNRFKNTIIAAKAKFAGKYDWLIVQHHKSTASVANHIADIDIQRYVEAGFETVMSEQGVDLVLAGHDHVYARSFPLAGKGGGKVSVPDKSQETTGKLTTNNATYTSPSNPIYLTFTTGSGLKYYQVSSDKTFDYSDAGVVINSAYPYLGTITGASGDEATHYGRDSYKAGMLPVSNAAYMQPWIPSYTVVDVNGKTITFKTYATETLSGQGSFQDAVAWSFDANVPYDTVTVTK